MAYTSEDKLRQVAKTKSLIKNAIIVKGVDVPENIPFRLYANYIQDIGTVETTTTRDMMMLADYFEDIMHGPYIHDNYTQEDEEKVINLLNLILNGSEE